MRLRNKVSLLVLIIWAIMFALSYMGSQYILQKSYLELEQKQASENTHRVYQAIEQMIDSVNTMVVNWSVWNDTYQFITDRNKAYIEANLPPTAFAAADLDLMLFYNVEGKPVFTEAVDSERAKEVPLPVGLEAYLDPKGKLLYMPEIESGVKGFISIPEGILLVAAHPILTSENKGPVRGTLVMGRYFNSHSLKTVSEVTKLNVMLHRMDEVNKNKELTAISFDLAATSDHAINRIVDKETLKGYKLLQDINGKPIAMLEITMPRAVYNAGLSTVRYFNLTLLAIGVFLITLLMYLIHRFVVKRLEELNSEIVEVSKKKEFFHKMNHSGDDEVSSVASEINNMLDVINTYHDEKEKMHQQLLTVSRQAGMAEVATSVLHNVGNILNSASTSTSVIDEMVSESHVNKLEKVSKIIKEHIDKRDDYLTTDESGKLIPEYLIKLSSEICEENKNVHKEIKNIDTHLNHIKDVVALQKDISGVADIKEKILLNEMIDIAINIVNPANEIKEDIKIKKDFQYKDAIISQKSKLLQMLVNLIKNAIDSVMESNNEPKTIDIILRKSKESNNVEIVIKDNGIGIEVENLTRIFSFGFTTKSDGHGFGLHSSAISVAELGGSMRAESEGRGKGAAFIIELPICIKETVSEKEEIIEG